MYLGLIDPSAVVINNGIRPGQSLPTWGITVSGWGYKDGLQIPIGYGGRTGPRDSQYGLPQWWLPPGWQDGDPWPRQEDQPVTDIPHPAFRPGEYIGLKLPASGIVIPTEPVNPLEASAMYATAEPSTRWSLTENTANSPFGPVASIAQSEGSSRMIEAMNPNLAPQPLPPVMSAPLVFPAPYTGAPTLTPETLYTTMPVPYAPHESGAQVGTVPPGYMGIPSGEWGSGYTEAIGMAPALPASIAGIPLTPLNMGIAAAIAYFAYFALKR